MAKGFRGGMGMGGNMNHVVAHNIALYSIGPCFYHQSRPQLDIVFALAPSLPSFWSYFSTDLQYACRKGACIWKSDAATGHSPNNLGWARP